MGQGLCLAEVQAGAWVFGGLGLDLGSSSTLWEGPRKFESFYIDISEAHQGLGSPFSEGAMPGPTLDIQNLGSS